MKNIHLPSLEFMIPLEVEIHYKRPIFNEMAHILKSSEAEKYLRRYINTNRIDHKEFFWLMLLNQANRLLAIAEVGQGVADHVAVNIAEIFQLALKTNASGIILCHNHPSGKLKASESDIRMTKNIQTLAKLFGMTVLDHIIITSESYISMNDEHLM